MYNVIMKQYMYIHVTLAGIYLFHHFHWYLCVHALCLYIRRRKHTMLFYTIIKPSIHHHHSMTYSSGHAGPCGSWYLSIRSIAPGAATHRLVIIIVDGRFNMWSLVCVALRYCCANILVIACQSWIYDLHSAFRHFYDASLKASW